MRDQDIPTLRRLLTILLIVGGIVAALAWYDGRANPRAAAPPPDRHGMAPQSTVVLGTSTPRPKPLPTASPVKPLSGAGDPGKLDIVDLTFGNFTKYSFDVFVDVANNTGTFYSSVWFDGVCRDDAGHVTGTGLANLSNFASGERAVATMTFIEVDPAECNVTVSVGDTYTS